MLFSRRDAHCPRWQATSGELKAIRLFAVEACHAIRKRPDLLSSGSEFVVLSGRCILCLQSKPAPQPRKRRSADQCRVARFLQKENDDVYAPQPPSLFLS